MEIVFFTMVDDCIVDFIKSNRSNQDISDRHEFIMLSTATSGEQCAASFKESYGERTKVIYAPSNSNFEKGSALLNYIKNKKHFDVLVKIDMDAIVMQYNLLIKTIEENLSEMTHIGNLNGTYIRGGCNAMPSELARKLEFVWNKRWRHRHFFDSYYNQAVNLASGKMKDVPLFEINGEYTGTLPVWHPRKTGRGARARWKSYKMFANNMEKYYKGIV